MTRNRVVVAVAAVGALALPAAAQAHVTVHPNALPAGGYTVTNLNVPTESDTASTVRIDVQFPAGVAGVSTMPVNGFRAKVTMRKAAKPLRTDDGDLVKTEVATISWTGGKVQPGEFIQLPMSFQVPNTPGKLLTFKAVQRYSNGKVVRWIAGSGGDDPAPQVLVTGANQPVQDFPAGVAAAKAQKASASSSGGHSHASSAAAPVALVLGLAGMTLLERRRRRQAR
jgi:uncharacterized protein YcnI